MSAFRFHPAAALAFPKERPSAMEFAIRDLSVLAYAQGFTLWHYKANPETLPRAAERGFFDAAAEMLACGDIVMVSSSRGGRLMVVAGNHNGVTTAPLG